MHQFIKPTNHPLIDSKGPMDDGEPLIQVRLQPGEVMMGSRHGGLFVLCHRLSAAATVFVHLS